MKKLLYALAALAVVALAAWFVVFCTSDVDVPRGGDEDGRRMIRDVAESGGRSAVNAPASRPARATAASAVSEPEDSRPFGSLKKRMAGGEMSRSELLRRLHIDSATFRKVVLTLHMCEMIKEECETNVNP